MKAFSKDGNYFLVLDRVNEEVVKVQKNSLEAEILNENNSLTGKKVVLGYDANLKEPHFEEKKDLINVKINGVTITGLISAGYHIFDYDSGHSVFVTDGIPAQRFF